MAELNVLFLMHWNNAKLQMAGFTCVNKFVDLMVCKTCFLCVVYKQGRMLESVIQWNTIIINLSNIQQSREEQKKIIVSHSELGK